MNRILRLAAAVLSGLLAGAVALCAAAAESGGAQSSNPLEILDALAVAHMEEGVTVPLRDGTQLMATLIIPNSAPKEPKLGAILVQSPYTVPDELRISRAIYAALVRAGYVLAVVNDRGTQWSEGEYHWLQGAAADGVDVVSWLTRQPWSNGTVGAMGCSSSGEVTFPLAVAKPPGLKAVVAMGAATGPAAFPVSTTRESSIPAACRCSIGRGGITETDSCITRSCQAACRSPNAWR